MFNIFAVNGRVHSDIPRREIDPGQVKERSESTGIASAEESRTPEVPVNRFATCEDFRGVFAENLNSLYQLCFLMTGKHDKAEECFIAGLDDCVQSKRVFKGWAHSWAKRSVIQKAIHTLQPHPSGSDSSLPGSIFRQAGLPTFAGGHFDIDTVLSLDDFERFVFVLSVLDRYSEADCVLLLGCSVDEIRKAQVRAFEMIVASGCGVLANERP
jgi:hypothetical protein